MQNADELREIQQLTNSIGKVMSDIAAASDKRNKSLEREVSMTKSILADIQSSEDIEKGLAKLERGRARILKTNYGVNQKMKNDLLLANKISQDGLKVEQKKFEILSRVAKITNSVADGITDGLDSLKSQIEEVPILGKVFSKLIPTDKIKESVGKMSDGFTRGFGIMFKRGLSQGKGFMGAFSGGMKAGFGQVSKALGPLLANPIGLAVAAIALIAGAGLLAFYKVSKAAKDFRKETGLLNSQTGELESNLAKVTSATAGMGGSIEQASSAASTFSNQMKGTSQASEAVLTSMVAMENSFGVSAEAQAKVNEQFQLMSGASAETAQNMIQTTIAAAEAAGVAPAKVMQDIAENAEAGMMFFQGSTKALAKAAIEARKMGTSIGETTKVAEGLLDFESSINNELELGAMLGTRVNFNKARALAFEGDMIGMQQAVNKEVGKLGDINKMNMYQKQALTKATGMDLKSLIKQQKIAKTLPGLKKEELAAANALLDAGMDIADISKDELKRKAIEMGNQKKMQSEFDNMGNSLKAMGTQLLMAFMPIGKLIMAVLGPVIGYITGVWAPIGRAIDGIFEAFEPISGMMKDIFGDGAGIAGIFEFIGTLVSGSIVFAINLFSNGLKVVTNIIGGIYDIFKGIKTAIDSDFISDNKADILNLLDIIAADKTLTQRESFYTSYRKEHSMFENLESFGSIKANEKAEELQIPHLGKKGEPETGDYGYIKPPGGHYNVMYDGLKLWMLDDRDIYVTGYITNPNPVKLKERRKTEKENIINLSEFLYKVASKLTDVPVEEIRAKGKSPFKYNGFLPQVISADPTNGGLPVEIGKVDFDGTPME